MSYLASIVARANGSTPLLQPRIASRYEHDLRGADTPPPEVTIDPQAQAPPTRSAPPTPIDAAARAAPAPQNAVPSLPPRESLRADAARSGRDPILSRDFAARPDRIVERETERIELQEQVIRTVPPAPPSAHLPISPMIESDGREKPLPDRNDGREPDDEAPLRALLRPPPLPAQPAAPERRGQASAAPDAHESAPTIRVTIGRVDVRAVEPQSSSRPTPPARTPAFTLDDYVRLRKEGRR